MNITNKLAIRIGCTILILGPILLIGSILLSTIINIRIFPLVFRRDILIRIILEFPIVIFITPLFLGFIVASFIRKPLTKLNAALSQLKHNNYETTLALTGIKEFDDVIEEFNNLCKQLETEEQLRKNLISDTSHELKTPLTALLAQLQAIQERVIPLDQDRITILYEQVQRLSSLIDKLEEYATIRSQTIHINKETIDLPTFVSRFCDKFYTHTDIPIIQGIESHTILSADSHLLERILINIIDNALHYSHASEIRITGNTKSLSISDNGIGISENDIPFIFERFFRVDASRNLQTGGMGLGLAITKEIVLAQGWRIHAYNANPGIKFEIQFTPTNVKI